MIQNFAPQFLNKLNEYKKIAIFIHVQPDFDAYGSAFALKKWIEDNYSDKKIFLMIPPETFKKNEKKLFNYELPLPHDSELHDSIGIVLDTPIHTRILTHMHSYCKELIIIDHHPKIDTFAQLEFINPIYPATTQILAELFFYLELQEKKIFASELAQYIYLGILTDTNNLMALNVLPSTYDIISKLIYKGINRSMIHDVIFTIPLKQKLFNSQVVDRMKTTKNGLAYSIVSSDIIKKYNMQHTNNPITNLENVEGIEIWTILIYDLIEKVWKCSIRSKDLHINTIATKFGGGGHKNMAAANLKTKKEYFKLLYCLDTYLKSSGFTNSSNTQKFNKSYKFLFYSFFFKYFSKDK